MLDLNRNFDDGLALQTAQALSAYEPPVKVEPAVCDYVAPTCFADIDTKMRDESREDFALSEGFEQFWRVLDPGPGNYRWQGKRVIGLIAEMLDYDRNTRVVGVWTEDDMKHMGVQVNDLDWDHNEPYRPERYRKGSVGQTFSGAVGGIAEMTQEAWAAIEPEPDAMAGLAINSESVQRARQRVDAYRMMIERRNTRPEPRRFTRVTLERDEMLRMAMAETRHPAWRTS